MGPHSRRSRLVFSKVFGPEVTVGAYAWVPVGKQLGPWWRSSERSVSLLKESVAYILELLFDSGRWLRTKTPQQENSYPKNL
jgi:hypothetical protein